MPKVFSKGGSVKIQSMNSSLKKVLVWDWSIRVFHWLFAVSVTLALGIAMLAGEHSPLFRWHMIFGLIAAFMLVLRVVLLVIGTKHVRLQSFVHAVRQLPCYIRGLSNRDDSGFAGHNPLAWIVYFGMFTLLGGVVASGVNMRSEWAEEGHSLMAWLLLVTIAAHMVGLVMLNMSSMASWISRSMRFRSLRNLILMKFMASPGSSWRWAYLNHTWTVVKQKEGCLEDRPYIFVEKETKAI